MGELGYSRSVVTVDVLMQHGDTGLGTFERVILFSKHTTIMNGASQTMMTGSSLRCCAWRARVSVCPGKQSYIRERHIKLHSASAE